MTKEDVATICVVIPKCLREILGAITEKGANKEEAK